MNEQNKPNDGGPAFPVNNIAESKTGEYVQLAVQSGMTLRDLFAAFAPEPTEDDYKSAFEHDRMADPYNEKGRRRGRKEIRASFKFDCADAMLAEREKLR